MVGTNGVSPEYFWYEMELDEVTSLFKAHERQARTSWEQTRIIAYNSVQWGKNPPKPTKFMPFDWDNGKQQLKKDTRTKEEKKNFSSQFINAIKINNGK